MFEAPGRPEGRPGTSKGRQILSKPFLQPACLYTGTRLLCLGGARLFVPLAAPWLRLTGALIKIMRLRGLWSDLGKFLAKYTLLQVRSRRRLP